MYLGDCGCCWSFGMSVVVFLLCVVLVGNFNSGKIVLFN